MMAVKYHGCTCHQRFCASTKDLADKSASSEDGNASEEAKPQPWYFHVIASFILVIHGFTFLVPQDPTTTTTAATISSTTTTSTVAIEDNERATHLLSGWIGSDLEWVKLVSPYAQGLAAVFNIALGLVSWWTSKESERYNRLIQLRVFAFCLNILHAYVTGPIIYQQGDDVPLLAPGRIIGLFRLSYLTPGLMAAGVTEVIVEKEQEEVKKKEKK